MRGTIDVHDLGFEIAFGLSSGSTVDLSDLVLETAFVELLVRWSILDPLKRYVLTECLDLVANVAHVYVTFVVFVRGKVLTELLDCRSQFIRTNVSLLMALRRDILTELFDSAANVAQTYVTGGEILSGLGGCGEGKKRSGGKSQNDLRQRGHIEGGVFRGLCSDGQ